MSKVIDFLTEKLFRSPPKNNWNYRVVERDLPGGISEFFIAEVYYREGKPHSYVGYFNEEFFTQTVQGVVKHMSPWGSSVSELEEDLKKMVEAFQRPVLQYRELTILDKEPNGDYKN